MGQLDRKSSSEDQALFERVERDGGAPALEDLSAEVLAAIADREGIDFATALLFKSLCASDQHQDFIRRVENNQEASDEPIETNYRIVIVPGAFYREFPQSGADGRLVIQTAHDLGIPVDVIPLKSFGLLEENGAIIADYLQKHADESVVLVSLSKGTSDFKALLSHPHADNLLEPVRAWISLSGIYYGTPIARWVLSSKMRSWWIQFVLWLRGGNFAVVRELDHGPDVSLSREVVLARQVPIVHIVGFALKRHLSRPLARRAYRRIQHLGPNDGGGILLADVLRLPGVVYPVWGSDHYLRPDCRDLQSLMRAILQSLPELMDSASRQPISTGADR